jgi:hypothetical protein
MFVLIFYTHRENVKRLKNKEETKTKIYWFDYLSLLSNLFGNESCSRRKSS